MRRVLPPTNDGIKIARSAATILLFTILGPLLVLLFMQQVESREILLAEVASILLLPIYAPALFIVLYCLGFLPSLLVGCFVALFSPSILRTGVYVLAAAGIGGCANAIFFLGPWPGAWSMRGLKLVACSTVASAVCAVLSSSFRSKPVPVTAAP